MKMHASNGCYLTQREDVPMSKRQFLTIVDIHDIADAANWKEITKKAKDEMMAKVAVVDVDNLTVEGIDNVAAILSGIATNINNVTMTKEQAIERTAFFPKWEEQIGKPLAVGFKMNYGGKLYEVLQEHTASEEWVPDSGTESLYKVIELEATGTIDDPIPYDGNMELFNGKYYTQNDVLYLCNRDSGQPMYHALADLVGLYVEIVNE